MAEKLEIGETYLSISLLGSVNCAAFKNKHKKNDTDPDYIGNGIAIWKKTKKAPVEKVADEGL